MAMKGVYMVWDVTQKKFYTEMGQQLEQRTLNVSVPPVNKGSAGKKERSQIRTNNTEQNFIG